MLKFNTLILINEEIRRNRHNMCDYDTDLAMNKSKYFSHTVNFKLKVIDYVKRKHSNRATTH